MRITFKRTLAVVALASPIAAEARTIAHKIGQSSTVVEGHPYRVVRFDDGSVKVVDSAVIGSGMGIELRKRMRIAVIQATGCEISDDFWLDGKLVGNLYCHGVAVSAQQQSLAGSTL